MWYFVAQRDHGFFIPSCVVCELGPHAVPGAPAVGGWSAWEALAECCQWGTRRRDAENGLCLFMKTQVLGLDVKRGLSTK